MDKGRMARIMKRRRLEEQAKAIGKRMRESERDACSLFYCAEIKALIDEQGQKLNGVEILNIATAFINGWNQQDKIAGE